MKNTMFYLIWILVISNMFYSEMPGLNALVISLFTILFFAFSIKEKLKNPKWWLASILWLGSGTAVFITGSILSISLFFITFLYFTAVHYNYKLSIPLGFLQSMQTFMTGFFFYFEAINKWIKKPKEERNNKWRINFIIFSATLLIAIVFLKLYQVADPNFYEMTKFINLDFISWGFIGFYFLLTFTLFGLYYYQGEQVIDAWESGLKDDVNPSYSDHIQKYLGLKNEAKGAIALLIVLNLMLILYNSLDLKFIFVDFRNPTPSLRYSEVIHESINALITSIVLVILIITYLFRGGLNFASDKWVKALAIFWLFQNVVMTITTSVKNYEYIAHWGLTYKRLGVYIYLILAVAGLVFTIVKVARKKSFWFLMRNMSIAFMTCFIIISHFDWDRVITKFNLTHIEHDKIDFEYLVSLGDGAYPELLKYEMSHSFQDAEIKYRLMDNINETFYELSERKSKTTWRSLVLNDHYLHQYLKAYRDHKNPRMAIID